MKKNAVIVFVLVCFAAGFGCKDKYDPPIITPQTGYLVVEGFINGNGPTEIKLSHTVQLEDSSDVKIQSGATVVVEGEDGSNFQLYETSAGTYTAESLPLNPNTAYRLHIYSNGSEYQSAYAKKIATPNIEAMPYARADDGVHIRVQAEDPTNSTIYYTWTYSETWEIVSRYSVYLEYTHDSNGDISGVADLPPGNSPDTTESHCWRTEFSSQILTASNLKLSKDRLDKEIMYIPNGSIKLDERYSIKINLHGCSAAGYDFLQRMAKNNEQLGSIFDAQPSELNGNLTCVSNPDEKVIGFVEVADGQEKRIFIRRQDIGGWNYNPNCEQLTKPNNVDTLKAWGGAYAPLMYTDPFKTSIIMGNNLCSYCTLQGIHLRPDFW